MGLRRRALRLANGVKAAVVGETPLARIARTGFFGADEIELVRNTYYTQGGAGSEAWAPFLDAHLQLPSWFRKGLPPDSEAYAEQQHRLWRLISGAERAYDPALHEKEAPWGDVDPVRVPGFYGWRGAQAIAGAADHVLASGMLLKHCGLQAGDWALEYGAGFAQTALALARMGVNVDTVDISQVFCDFVQRQADFFRVPLHPFRGQFNLHPRPGQRYKLIWFYESFHHCLDFERVVSGLGGLLAEGGRVILAGEPIVAREYVGVPYPWGVRLHSEVAAVMRQQQWFELGFTEAFIYELFARSGFKGRRIDCEPSLFGRLYVFEM